VVVVAPIGSAMVPMVRGWPRQLIEMNENSRAFDLVPFRCPWRVVAHRDGQSGLGGKMGEMPFQARTR
jgi:hypothetical protein